MCVLHYIKSNPRQGLLLNSTSEIFFRSYCSSDWMSCPFIRRSITSYFITFGQSPVSWKSRKWHTISRSFAEAKYWSITVATFKLLWIKTWLQDLGGFHSMCMKLYCDNQSTIHIASDEVFSWAYKTYWIRLSVLKVEPITFKEVITSSKWIDVMKDEIQSLEKNEVWELAPLRKVKKSIHVRWVFKIKINHARRVVKRKESMWISQNPKINYEEVFAPVTRIKTIRIVVVIVNSKGCIMYQIYANFAYPKWSKKKEGYVSQTLKFMVKV